MEGSTATCRPFSAALLALLALMKSVPTTGLHSEPGGHAPPSGIPRFAGSFDRLKLSVQVTRSAAVITTLTLTGYGGELRTPSLTVSKAVYVPGSPYEWVTTAPLALVPSPKSQW
jgi:hypothetical protein